MLFTLSRRTRFIFSRHAITIERGCCAAPQPPFQRTAAMIGSTGGTYHSSGFTCSHPSAMASAIRARSSFAIVPANCFSARPDAWRFFAASARAKPKT